MNPGTLREWESLTNVINAIPTKFGLLTKDVIFTCIDASPEYIIWGTNTNQIVLFNRNSGTFQKLKVDNVNSEITCVHGVSSGNYLIACGCADGSVAIFQIPPPPNNLKTDPRFAILPLHTCRVTTLEWSKNAMKLFSGDENGVVYQIETLDDNKWTWEMIFQNNPNEIVQLSYLDQCLLVSTVLDSFIVKFDGDKRQVGKQPRKKPEFLGAIFWRDNAHIKIISMRANYRVWIANLNGDVECTHLFKEAILSGELPEVLVLNPMPKTARDLKLPGKLSFGRVVQLNERFFVTYNEHIAHVIDVIDWKPFARISYVRNIRSVACCDGEMFILDGERNLIRFGFHPDSSALSTFNSTSLLPIKSLLNITNRIKDAGLASNIGSSIATIIPAFSNVTESAIVQNNLPKSTVNSARFNPIVIRPTLNVAGEIFASPNVQDGRLAEKKFGCSRTDNIEKLEKFRKIAMEPFDSQILYRHGRAKRQCIHVVRKKDTIMSRSCGEDMSGDVDEARECMQRLSTSEYTTPSDRFEPINGICDSDSINPNRNSVKNFDIRNDLREIYLKKSNSNDSAILNGQIIETKRPINQANRSINDKSFQNVDDTCASTSRNISKNIQRDGPVWKQVDKTTESYWKENGLEPMSQRSAGGLKKLFADENFVPITNVHNLHRQWSGSSDAESLNDWELI